MLLVVGLHINCAKFCCPLNIDCHVIPTFQLMPTLTYPARTDQIDLYPNSDVNRVLRAVEYIRSLRSSVLYGPI